MTQQLCLRHDAGRWITICALLIAGATIAVAEDLRVYEQGKRPADARLREPKDLNGYFPFEVPDGKAAWEARAAEIRRRV